MSFFEKAGKVGKAIGKDLLKTLESDAKYYSKDSKRPDELREKYREFGESVGNIREAYFEDEDNDDDY